MMHKPIIRKSSFVQIAIASTYHISAHTGGNEYHAHHLAEGLSEAGHKVTYYTGDCKTGYGCAYEIIKLPINTFLGKALPSKKWFKKVNAHIFHAFGSGLPLLVMARVNTHIPRLLTYAADSNPTSIIMKAAVNFEQTLIRNSFDCICTTTPNYMKLLQHRWPEKKITWAPLMLRLKLKNTKPVEEKNSKNHYRLLFVGSLSSHHYYKGFNTLLEAMQTLPKQLSLQVIGDGDMKAMYQARAQQLKIKKIRFHGRVSDEALIKQYQKADLFVFPSNSNSEGFGLALMEAMAAKVPTITTTAIGPADWYKREQITHLVTPNDVTGLSDMIQKVLKKDNNEMIKKAYAFTKQFTQKNMVEKNIEMYQSMLGSKSN